MPMNLFIGDVLYGKFTVMLVKVYFHLSLYANQVDLPNLVLLSVFCVILSSSIESPTVYLVSITQWYELLMVLLASS